MVTEVALATVNDETVNVVLAAPAATVTLAGVEATPGALLDRVTTAPPAGAALVRVTVPCAAFPPTTLEGFSETDERVGAPGAPCGIKRREADQFPATPAEFLARTLHQCWTEARPLTLV